MKRKQNKKNNKIETPTPIKTSRNWFVDMPGCGRGVVDAESVDDVIMDVVERVELVVVDVVGTMVLADVVEAMVLVDVVGTMVLADVVLKTVDVVGVVVVEEMLDKLELEAVIPGFMTVEETVKIGVVGETVATGVVLVVELIMDVLLEDELEGTDSVSPTDSLIVLLSSVV